MATQLSKKRREYVMSMATTVKVWGAQIAVLAVATYTQGEPLEAETVERVLAVQADASVEALEALEAAELKLAQELSEDDAGRAERDEAGEALWEALRYLRHRLSEDADAATRKRLGFQQRPPVERGLVLLARYARAVLSALEANATTIEPLMGAPYKTADMVAMLKPRLERLEAAQRALALESRETQQARKVRDEALARYRRVVPSAAAIIEGFCRQAGLPDVAERVRPSARRMSGRLDEDPLPESDDDGGQPAPA